MILNQRNKYMITKEKFKEIMTELLRIKKDEEKLNTAFRNFEPDFNYISFGRYETLVVKTLKEAMNDECDWIGYWLYELDSGKIATKNSVSIDGKNIPIKTLDDLYECITYKNHK